ncbi:hypothetical protein SAMN05892877_10579 [Rhizobium subbaraonis]|uniref:Uncharacterized protein n=1 Tax=Rhizobium subbaraonis TaxID=908946 RepID=A0A285UDC4_9HYPH|nr:hypothetical protein [Rhizobium subbaraonis]SOC38311.1 hypothetical protein SAMN05892877_10579 [Rhizobium subbaraonis]
MPDDPFQPDQAAAAGRRLDPPIHREVERAACALMLFPEFVCRRRPCRRALSCVLLDDRDRRPCLGEASAAARALHRAICCEALRLIEMLAYGASTPVTPLSRDPTEREVQEAAAAVVRAMLPRGGTLEARFNAWRRGRNALTAPPHAGRELAEYRHFLRFINARPIAPDLEGLSPAVLPGGRPGWPQ